MVIYGTTTIPSDQIEVLAGGTVSVGVAFERTVGLIGGMDTANGSASTGSVVSVTSPPDAQKKFGQNSELHEAVKLAFNNGAAEVQALPVTETTVTAEQKSTQSGTLDNAPIMDPDIHSEHTIDVVDTGGTNPATIISYDVANETLGTDEVAVNPVTGDYEADAAPTGANYEFDYTYGDYSSTELAKMVDESPRIIGVLTENESVVNDAATEVNSNATNFDFMHVVAGADPVHADGAVATTTESSNYATNYSDSVDERRVSLVSAARGYIDESNTDQERTVSAVAGYLAGLSLGISSTNDSIGGFTDIRTSFQPSDAGDLIDVQVMPLIDYPPVTIVKDMTTSTEPKFERVFTMQIVDEATELSHQISREFVGDQNTSSNRTALQRSHRNAYIGMETNTPPLLDDFTVSVTEDSSNADEVDVNIGLQPVDVMDVIDVTITVGDVVRGNTQS